MHTEAEAKTKWCPFVRAPLSENGGNVAINSDGSRTCIASDCMAWRWHPLQADDAFKDAVIQAAKDIGDKTENKHKAARHVIANRAAYGLPVAPFDGFCGLASKP